MDSEQHGYWLAMAMWSCPAFVDTVVRRRVLLVRAAARS
jgi:hypothetical protein